MNKKILKQKVKSDQLFLITGSALPEILYNVLKAKDLVDNKKMSVANATSITGVSRTTYYKYCDNIFYFDSIPGLKTISLDIMTKDTVGLLSKITNTISKDKFNILTINQSAPIKKKTIVSVQIVMTKKDSKLSDLTSALKKIDNVLWVKIKKVGKDINE